MVARPLHAQPHLTQAQPLLLQHWEEIRLHITLLQAFEDLLQLLLLFCSQLNAIGLHLTS